MPDKQPQPANAEQPAPTGIGCTEWLGVLRAKAQRANRHGKWKRDGTKIRRLTFDDGVSGLICVCRMNMCANEKAREDCTEHIAAFDPDTVLKLLDMIEAKTPNDGTQRPRN